MNESNKQLLEVKLVDIMSLVALAQVVATITLCGTLVVLHWSTMRRKGVLPLALSYFLIAAIAGYRTAAYQLNDLFVQSLVILAYLIGDVGLVALLVRTRPQEKAAGDS